MNLSRHDLDFEIANYESAIYECELRMNEADTLEDADKWELRRNSYVNRQATLFARKEGL